MIWCARCAPRSSSSAPLLARSGHARVSLPGGCAIGTRPVDLHLKALAQLGAEIELSAGYIEARAPDGPTRLRDITFPTVTVTGTENVLMAATLARGETILATPRASRRSAIWRAA